MNKIEVSGRFMWICEGDRYARRAYAKIILRQMDGTEREWLITVCPFRDTEETVLKYYTKLFSHCEILSVKITKEAWYSKECEK